MLEIICNAVGKGSLDFFETRIKSYIEDHTNLCPENEAQKILQSLNITLKSFSYNSRLQSSGFNFYKEQFLTMFICEGAKIDSLEKSDAIVKSGELELKAYNNTINVISNIAIYQSEIKDSNNFLKLFSEFVENHDDIFKENPRIMRADYRRIFARKMIKEVFLKYESSFDKNALYSETKDKIESEISKHSRIKNHIVY